MSVAAPSRSREEDPAVQAEGLVYRYKGAKAPAVHESAFKVQRGEFYGLLGPNGAGKTTLLALLCGRLAPARGSVRILGRDPVRQWRRVRPRIGLVPQDIALYQQLSAEENLFFFGRMLNLSTAVLRQLVHQSLEQVGLEDYAGRRPDTFSGGMRRRLNLAAGILHRPELLFLDEPTVGIDTQSRNLVHEQLTRLHREGMTIIYTTHYLEEAEKLCSRVGIMDSGRLLREGTPHELSTENGCRDLEDLFLQLTGKNLRDS